MGNESTEIRELLLQLNHWEQKYGTAYKGDSSLKDKGEANARIQDLKAKLGAFGAQYHWDGNQYVLDSSPENDQLIGMVQNTGTRR
ncbi:MAG: hypothetical protein KAT20_04385 [Desulfuromonadales bacterium]|jgi:hypothetical protein|nr:hypothetical protein [Desulfuromonadales bacterium]